MQQFAFSLMMHASQWGIWSPPSTYSYHLQNRMISSLKCIQKSLPFHNISGCSCPWTFWRVAKIPTRIMNISVTRVVGKREHSWNIDTGERLSAIIWAKCYTKTQFHINSSYMIDTEQASCYIEKRYPQMVWTHDLFPKLYYTYTMGWPLNSGYGSLYLPKRYMHFTHTHIHIVWGDKYMAH